MDSRRPMLALPYTVVSGDDTVTLVAGEDHRYVLELAGLERWLPRLLARFDGRTTLDSLIEDLPMPLREKGREIVDRLRTERVVVDGPVEAAHAAKTPEWTLEGAGRLHDTLLAARKGEDGLTGVAVLAQDTLDYHAAARFNELCLHEERAWIWTTSGPMSRGYVSPLFLPDAGPCFACLLTHFKELSPNPAIYDSLERHGRRGLAFAPVPFPDTGIDVLRALVLHKLQLATQSHPDKSLYELHVLELRSMSVSVERVFPDPRCAVCGAARR